MPKTVDTPDPRPSAWALTLFAASIAFALVAAALLTTTL